MNILIIEDEPAIRDTLRDLLELNGHTVVLAATGEEGLRRFEDHPDLILCDIGLPGLDGYEVLKAIQQKPGSAETPFIFLTARADRVDQRRGMALGADDFITKPFTERDVLDAIGARVARQRPLRERIEHLLSDRTSVAEANWSHELMTPLNGVLGGLELIESTVDTIPPAELKELLALVRAGAERQLILSRKLVTYFSLERERSANRRDANQTCLPHEIVEQLVRTSGATANRTSDVSVDCTPALAAVAGPRFAEAISELVENALRFSEPAQPVTAFGRSHGGCYQVTIADAGPGMTADERAHLGPFVRFPRGGADRPGLGLGLAIVQSIAALTGSELTLAANPAGRGLAATLSVPLGDQA